VLLRKSVVPTPKASRGLGIEYLKSWSKELDAKHLQVASTEKEYLWTKWIHMHQLKGVICRNTSTNLMCASVRKNCANSEVHLRFTSAK